MIVFPRWTNHIKYFAGLVFLAAPVYLTGLIWYGASPKTTDVGYAPDQPIPYSHALHAGQLQLDCRYCHTGAFHGAQALIPSTEICMNCHASIKPDSALLDPLRKSYKTGLPIPWVRVHDLPDYVYFNHSAHTNRGVGCVSCHGRVDTMDVVRQTQTLSMGWCLGCHRRPEQHLRPLDKITDMTWTAPDQQSTGSQIKQELDIKPSTDCSTCHR